MASSIDNLSENLKGDQYREMSEVFNENIDILVRKGAYPYDYMDSFERFNGKKLLPKKNFIHC